jgi:dipeptidyl aminopeptidase/acylaminoacyl peptidase
LLVLAAAPAGAADLAHPGETHLRDVTQLTFGGENAEAYWSPDGAELVFQSTRPPYECDQIFRMTVPSLGGDGSGDTEAPPEPALVSTGDGRTTCAYFTDGGERILYSTTRFATPGCPPRPDHSQGYVWPIYSSYEIVTVPRDGGGDPVRLTDNDAYDAEATLCPVDGSIVFTSTRDGDLDLYRMDPDGSNVRRLTDTPGYDGGAFFSADCSKIVWRASRPRPGEELDDYRSLLTQGLVRPGELELWVADADGGNARQVTYLGAASFAPYFFPSGDRIIFSSNYGNDSPREFDLWAVDVQGTRLERITTSPGFDGFPMFSPDGSRLAFASNRHQGAPGETNIFVARWVAGEPAGSTAGQTAGSTAELGGADRFLADVAWLADDARGGRGLGTPELDQAADWLAGRFAEIGLEPGGDPGEEGGGRGYLQRFEAPVGVEAGDGTLVAIGIVGMNIVGHDSDICRHIRT